MDKSKEDKLRRELARHGYLLRKSRRANGDDPDNYMIVDAATNAVVHDSRYELDLDDIRGMMEELIQQ